MYFEVEIAATHLLGQRNVGKGTPTQILLDRLTKSRRFYIIMTVKGTILNNSAFFVRF